MVFAIFIVAIIKQHGVCRHTLPEILEVAVGLRSPACFGNGNETGQREPFHVVAVAHVLGPESTLHAIVRFGRNGLIVRFAHIVGAVAGTGRILCGVALFAVDVVGAPRRIDVFQPQLGRLFGSGFGSGPAVDQSVGRLHRFGVGITCRDGLVPHGQLAPFRLHKFGHLFDEMTLQLAVVGQSQFPVTRLAFGIVLPCRGGTFVAADVDGFIGEKLYQFLQNVLGKLHGLRVGYVEDVARNAAIRPYHVVAVRIAAVFGIGGHGCHEVAGHVDFRHNLNVKCFSIVHHFAYFFLGVEVGTVGFVNPILRTGVQIGEPRIGRDTSHRSQARIFLNFHAPTLVVTEVPVETVHLVIGHHVEHSLHLLHAEEVARHVEHEATVFKPGLIHDAHHGQAVSRHVGLGHTSHDMGRQHLLDGLESVEQAERSLAFDRNLVLRYFHVVSSVLTGRSGGQQTYLHQRRVVVLGHRNGGTGCYVIISDKSVHLIPLSLIQSCATDHKTFGQVQRTFPHCHLFGFGSQVDKCLSGSHA